MSEQIRRYRSKKLPRGMLGGYAALPGRQVSRAPDPSYLLSEAKKRLDRLEALLETGRAVVSILDLDTLLNLIIEQAARLLEAEGGMLNLVDWDTGTDQAVACTGAAVEGQGYRLPLDQTLSGWVTLHNQPVISNQIKEDPRAFHHGGEGIFSRPLFNAAAAPLSVKDHVIGSLVMVNKISGTVDFEPADLDLLVGFAAQAAAAIDNARLYEQAQRAAVLEERNRLARELHDAVTQTLFSASLIAEALPASWENDPRQAGELLLELRRLNRGALAEMRALLLELRPSALEETSLPDLLYQLGEAACGRTGIPVTVTVQGEGKLPLEVHVAFYRIAQEALSNVVKHAGASQVAVRLVFAEPGLEGKQNQYPGALLSVQDNGRGFDPAQPLRHRLGLNIMQERAQKIGAKLVLDSRPEKGTRVLVIWGQVGEQNG